MTTISDIGERGYISRIRAKTPQSGDGVVVGIGDDCAVVRQGGDSATDLVLKSDCVIAGRHFDAGTEGRLVGRKAVGRVLSDIAAMGATPRWFLVDMVAPPDTPLAFAEDVHAGMMELAGKHNFSLVGGDTAQGPVFELHVFGAGDVPRGEAVLRSGAKPGDGVYVTGALGGNYASGKHLNFAPRVREGQALRGVATSMIDISDGLACELRHIANESGVTLEIESSLIPLNPGSTLDNALHDGEDFELLFTANEISGFRDFGISEPIKIGKIAAGSAKVLIDGNELPAGGFDHFAN